MKNFDSSAANEDQKRMWNRNKFKPHLSVKKQVQPQDLKSTLSTTVSK